MILIFHPNALYISSIEVAWKYIYNHICPILCKPADLDVEIHIKKKKKSVFKIKIRTQGFFWNDKNYIKIKVNIVVTWRNKLLSVGQAGILQHF